LFRTRCSSTIVDIDECAVNNGNCSQNATCNNVLGSYECTCMTGFSGDGFNCTGECRRAIFSARCYASAAYAVVWCPSVCPSVPFVYSVETYKRIVNFFSSSDSHTILVFLYQTSWPYSDEDPPTPLRSHLMQVGYANIAILDE